MSIKYRVSAEPTCIDGHYKVTLVRYLPAPYKLSPLVYMADGDDLWELRKKVNKLKKVIRPPQWKDTELMEIRNGRT